MGEGLRHCMESRSRYPARTPGHLLRAFTKRASSGTHEDPCLEFETKNMVRSNGLRVSPGRHAKFEGKGKS